MILSIRNRVCNPCVLYPAFRTVSATAMFAAVLGASSPISRAQAKSDRQPNPPAPPSRPCTITIKLGKSPINRFRSDDAFGAGVDGLEHGDIDKVYTEPNLKAMLGAGFKPLSYRLRTELGDEAWHWNPVGSWSDFTHKQGYWTSSAESAGLILTSYGYKLPRRGNTIDQANNNGYSRILDNDSNSFWKSNPYLDKHFTGGSNSDHPQWIMIDVGKRTEIDAIRILWAKPFAVKFQVEYCVGTGPPGDFDASWQRWKRFPHGSVLNGSGGSQLLSLCDRPKSTRYVRIMMLRSSYKGPGGSSDIRDRLGFAVREIYLGIHVGRRGIRDLLKHGCTARKQSAVYVSSTDPWHRAADIDLNIEQPGIDRVFASGLTNELPALMSVGVLYDTPDNAAELVKYMHARNYPIRGIELGEEPDGQQVLPEDYAALYVQCAQVLHGIDSKINLGGPALQTSVDGYLTWEDNSRNRSWLNRFVRYLANHRKLSEFAFFSFEWYPFDDAHSTPSPESNSRLLNRTIRQFRLDGIPQTIPWLITEFGYSSFAGKPEVEMPGALVNSETVAQFLSLGGSSAYFYGYEPNSLMREAGPDGKQVDSWGNLTLFLSDDERRIKSPVATYYAARMLTQEWVQRGSDVQLIYGACSNFRTETGDELVSAFPLLRPDGKWSILVLNKDRNHTISVTFEFVNEAGSAVGGPKGLLEMVQYGPQQYVWHPNGPNGYALPNDPPRHSTINSTDPIMLPPYSITVIRGAGPSISP